MDAKTNQFMALDASYEEAEIVVFGAPFDGTCSYRPGTRFAPNAMRVHSEGIEVYSPYQDSSLEDIQVFDSGDIDLPFGNKQRVLDMVAEHTKKILEDGKKPVMLGGEHLLTLPAVLEVHKQYEELVVVQLDAHADLREDYMGENLSHATVIRRIHDTLGDHRIVQLGIRSGTKEEFAFGKEHTIFRPFGLETRSFFEELKGKPIYLTIDLDVFDPSIFPGTGTPEPGGVDFREWMSWFSNFKSLNIVAADVMELSPDYDHSGVSTILACKVLREVLLGMSSCK